MHRPRGPGVHTINHDPDSDSRQNAGAALASQSRSHRDLAWSLQSAPLCTGDAPLWPDDDWFRTLPTPRLDEYPHPRDPHHFRLGQHFEALYGAWLGRCEDRRALKANLQVQAGKRTLGEFDPIVEDRGAVEHWELAVKFYLGHGPLEQASAWYGPNTADRLDIKVGRMLEHQLLLSSYPEASALLQRLHIDLERVRCIIKGRLFYPAAIYRTSPSAPRTLPRPAFVNPTHEAGWWMTVDEFSRLGPGAIYAYLPKSLWLAPLLAGDAPLLNHGDVCALLSGTRAQHTIHFAIVDDTGIEQSRGFIVNQQWLDAVGGAANTTTDTPAR